MDNVDVEDSLALSLHIDQPGRYLRWTVSDTGHGIPPEVIDRIFEPFFTTKSSGKGTGLGLSIIVGVVKSHQGYVRVGLPKGGGTSFEIYLPADRDSSEIPKDGSHKLIISGNEKTVLVVDDASAVRETLKLILQANHFKVLLAENGSDGLKVFLENREQIDLVITDVAMPVMNGYEFVRSIRSLEPKQNVIVMSGSLEENGIDELRSMGINAILDKPFTENLLMSELSNIFYS